jgi:hypothetical protein
MSVRISGSSAEKASSMSMIGAFEVSARAMPTRCCMPPESCGGYWSPSPAEAHAVEPRVGLAVCAAPPRHPCTASAMPRSAARSGGAEARISGTPSTSARCRRSQRTGAVYQDILAVEEDLAGGRFDQPVEVADQRRFARSRQAHDDGDVARLHVDVDVVEAQHMAVFLEQFALPMPFLERGHDMLRIGAEDLVEMRISILVGLLFRSRQWSPTFSAGASMRASAALVTRSRMTRAARSRGPRRGRRPVRGCGCRAGPARQAPAPRPARR